MKFIERMLRYLFWVFVVSWSVAILRRIVARMISGGVQPNAQVNVPDDASNKKLVRDPVCGMHVAEGLALPLNRGAEILHFCSAECREKYLNDAGKMSASA
jgi:YHS domain-containing protein